MFGSLWGGGKPEVGAKSLSRCNSNRKKLEREATMAGRILYERFVGVGKRR